MNYYPTVALFMEFEANNLNEVSIENPLTAVSIILLEHSVSIVVLFL